MKFLLAGNPNCGKTTLFNALTGLNERVGNYSGVTVSLKEGVYKKDKSITFTDIPGAYSTATLSVDETVAITALKTIKCDGIIVVVDGTKLERSLYFVCELLRLKKPITVAVNFYDELVKNGINVDFDALSKALGVPVIGISAKRNINLDKLIKLVVKNVAPPKADNSIFTLEYIKKVVDGCVNYKKTKAETITEKLDKVLLSKAGYLILALALFITFYVSDKVGGFISGYLDKLFDLAINSVSTLIAKKYGLYVLSDFITDGVLKGAFSVIGFLPNVLVVFIFLSFFEYTGYTARIAFLMEKLLSSVGLSGKSIMPFIISCGCTVTGVMATKIIEDSSKRNRTALLTAFMPCSAKLVVINYLATIISPYPYIITVSIYLLSILLICVLGSIFSKTGVYGSGDFGFLMELPTFRTPTVKDVFRVLSEKVKSFLIKAGSIIAITNIIIWVLSSFSFKFNYVGSLSGGMLKEISRYILFIFKPLGFLGWEAVASLFSGIFAREGIVSALSGVNLDRYFLNDFSAYGFLAFVSFYPPCLSAIISVKNLIGKKYKLIFPIIVWFITAYFVALIINFLGLLFYKNILIFFVVLGLFFLCFLAFCIKIAYGKKTQIFYKKTAK